MRDLQKVFDKIQEIKKEQKELRKSYKQALDDSPSYKEVKDELTVLREKKKQIELGIKEEFSKELDRLEDLKIDAELEAEMLSDIALSKLVKGETVEVTDSYNNKYEPVFMVRFKKT